jgi:hypothetical protein
MELSVKTRVAVCAVFARDPRWQDLVGKHGEIVRIKGKMIWSHPLIQVELDRGDGAYWFSPRELRALSLLDLIAEAAV